MWRGGAPSHIGPGAGGVGVKITTPANSKTLMDRKIRKGVFDCSQLVYSKVSQKFVFFSLMSILSSPEAIQGKQINEIAYFFKNVPLFQNLLEV